MRYLPNTKIACLEYHELVPIIMTMDAYNKARSRGRDREMGGMIVHGRGGNGNKVLIEVDSLADKYKEAVYATYGDPDELITTNPIKELVVYDLKAEGYYTGKRLTSGNRLTLTPEHIEKYSTAASWLNMLVKVTGNKRVLKETLHITMEEFWGIIGGLLEKEGVALPRTRKRLQEKIADYQVKGYETLIDGAFGNGNRLKLVDETCRAVLQTMLEHHNQFDCQFVAHAYNKWAKVNGYEPISRETVVKYKNDNAFEVTAGREGWGTWGKKYGKSILGERPSAPLLLCEHDDNRIDVYFTNGNGSDHNRPIGIFIIDTYNDYLLGYALGWGDVSTALMGMAWLNAVNHIKELTGEYYLPHQLRSDRFGMKTMRAMYDKLATYTPAKAHNAQGKYIEQSFSHYWHLGLKLCFPHGYTGYNVIGKTDGVNREVLGAEVKLYKHQQSAGEEMERFVNYLRMLPATVNSGQRKRGELPSMTRQEQWLTAFNDSDKSKENKVDIEWVLLNLGVRRERHITVTRDVMMVEMGGLDYAYQVPRDVYMQVAGSRMTMVYDPEHMGSMLFVNDQYRFVGYRAASVPRAIADYAVGDRMRLNSMLAMKEGYVTEVAERSDKRNKTLSAAGIDREALVKVGYLQPKVIAQAAEEVWHQLPDSNVTVEEAEEVDIWAPVEVDFRDYLNK